MRRNPFSCKYKSYKHILQCLRQNLQEDFTEKYILSSHECRLLVLIQKKRFRITTATVTAGFCKTGFIILIILGAVVVAQLVERLRPTSKVCSSNPDICKISFTNCTIEKTTIKKKRPGMAHL